MAQDPTREEIDAALATFPYASECDDFDREEAIYTYASQWHGGQWSNLYSVLSMSPFNPGPMWSEPDPDGMSAMLVDHLVEQFGTAS